MRELRFETLVKQRTAALIGLTVVVVDQVTKSWARTTLIGSPRTVIPNLLSWEYAENTGAAFGLLRGSGAGILLGFAAIIAMGIVAYAVSQASRTPEVVGLALIGGGAAGNLVDRITNSDQFLAGFVVDWIRLPNFPNFNVADSSITVGAAMLIWMAWRADGA